MRREEKLDLVEDLAFKCVVRMAKFLEDNPDLPVPPAYVKQLKDAHSLLLAGAKVASLDEDGEPETMLVRLEEIKARLVKKVQAKHQAEEAARAVAGVERRIKFEPGFGDTKH